MDKIFITFRSITLAQRGERALRAGGVDHALIRTPKELADRGCGYSLRLRAGDRIRAQGLLDRDRVPYSRIYAHSDDGTPEVLWP